MSEPIFVKLDTEYSKMPYEYRANIDNLIHALDGGFVLPSAIPCNFFKNRETAKKILTVDGNYLEYMPLFKSDREMVLTAVGSSGSFALMHANPKFLKDYEIGWKTIEEDGMVPPLLEKLLHDKTFCIKACILEPAVFSQLPPEFQSDLDIIKPMLAYTNFFDNYSLPNDIVNIPEIAKIILEHNGSNLAILDPKYADDEEYVHIAMKSSKWAYESLSDELQHKAEFIEMAKGIPLWLFPTDVRNGFSKEYLIEAIHKGLFDTSLYGDSNIDRDVIKESLAYCREIYLPEGYKDDEELALIGLKNKYSGSKFFLSISPSLMGNKDFAIKAVGVNTFIYNFLPSELKEDKDVVRKLFISPIKDTKMRPYFPFSEIPEQFKHDQEIVELALKQKPNVWNILPPDMQTDENLLVALKYGLNTRAVPGIQSNATAIKEMMKNPNSATSFRAFPEKMLTESFVKKLLRNGANIGELPCEHPMRNDKEALIIWFNAGHNVFPDEDMRCTDFDVALAAVKSSSLNIELLSDDLRQNPEIKAAATARANEEFPNEWYKIPSELQTKEMVMARLQEAPCFYGINLKEGLDTDIDLAILACKLDSSNLKHVDKRLLSDDSFLNSIKDFCPKAQILLEKKEFLDIFNKTNKIKRVEIEAVKEV